MTLVTSTIGQGLLWGILALGLYLSFRILNFPDMTVEGTFTFTCDSFLFYCGDDYRSSNWFALY